MKTRTRVVQFCLACLCSLVLSGTALAAAVVNIAPSGSAGFVVQGSGLQGVGGIQLAISYDTSTLSNPRITQGSLVSGALFVANPAAGPGVIKLAIASATGINGSGPLASISFDAKGSSAGRITSMTGSLLTLQGAAIPASMSVTAPPSNDTAAAGSTVPAQETAPKAEAPASETEGNVATTGKSTTVGGGLTLAPGTVSMPGETPQAAEPPKAEEAAAEADAAKEEAVPTVAEAPAEPVSAPAAALAKKTVDAGVLGAFKAFRGVPTPQALLALFDSARPAGISQEPKVALSDGKTKLRLVVAVASSADKVPNFALKGARLASLKKLGGGNWQVEAVPEAGAAAVSLTMVAGGAISEYALTVAPPMDQRLVKSMTEETYSRFLKERGTAGKPSSDLNGDGVRDYRDDFIYSANYLVVQQGKGQKSSKK